ncbi:D-alanyl-D-alanine carboxypeptidase family protein [Clostridium sp. CCUG 7971]|uniref:D-alanyl-D-alanine carboxypeptidase family protein n=1 Tax=Clostridium sp. CCUG 7971 TaxID=2811414 RepID=UPI001ABB3027|nr:D-alanyl-D-alanine carboxypeptidase family protein [Clostridium sp. CCUG 7971]MBO3443246.1 D-alanyl-D-alanine carboxypeptidase [Clostridium sp. CCUG 7971]
MKRILSLLVSCLIAFTSFLSTANISFANNAKPNLTAEHAVLMDYETGKVLYDKNGSSKLYPASTTKAWTAYVVLKHVPDLSQVVEIKDLPPVDGSSMYLKNGESFNVKQLLDALLVHSSNDVAVVLARYVGGGSVEKFVELMNKEAKAIGAKNTHFNNPHGLPDTNHYTTAYDMALMAREAMNNEIFRNIVKTKSISYQPSESYPHERYFVNTNKFLTSNEKINYKGNQIDIKYDIVDGIKTGYTDDAGRCLLSSAVKDNMRLISAVFKTTGNDLYLDSRTLLDYGYENFYSTTIVTKEKQAGTKKIFLSKQKELSYEPEYSYKRVLPKGQKESSYTTKANLARTKLPIRKGDKVGTLDVYNSGKLEHSIDLIAKNNVNSVFAFITENKAVMSIIKLATLIVISLVIIVIAFVIMRKRRKKRKPYNRNIYSKKRGKHSRRRR